MRSIGEGKAETVAEDVCYQKKSIASIHYFERYFTYDVAKGDLSDLVVVNLIKNVALSAEAEWKQALTDIFARYPVMLVMRKLNSHFAAGTAQEKEGILVALGSVSQLFSKKEEGDVVLDGQTYFFSMFGNLVLDQEKKDAAIKIVNTIIAHADSAEFIIRVAEVFEKAMLVTIPLNSQNVKDLQVLVIERCFAVSAEQLIAGGFPRQVVQLLVEWKRNDKPAVETYLAKLLKEDDQLFFKIIKGFISGNAPYEDALFDFQKSDYDRVVGIADKEKIKDSFLKLFSANELSQEPEWAKFKARPNSEQTDLNIARQFMHHYMNKPVPGPPRLKGM